MCDLPMTTEGYKHILVTVCYLSRYVLARPLKTKTSEEVITALQDIYLEVGVPKIVQHDQGKEFTSNVMVVFTLYYIYRIKTCCFLDISRIQP